MAKRKTDDTETVELLLTNTDLRTTWGNKVWEAICTHYRNRNMKAIGLLKSLKFHYEGQPLINIESASLVDYVRLNKGIKNPTDHVKCICGEKLTRHAYKMRVTGHAKPTGIERHITTVVSKDRNLRRQSTDFILGNDCFKNFPKLLEPTTVEYVFKPPKEALDEKSKELESMVLNFSAELKSKLEDLGLDSGQAAQLTPLIANNPELLDGDESGILFNLDPGRRRGFTNWFGEQSRANLILDEDVLEAYTKLSTAAHLLKPGDLALMAAYSYEHRLLLTDAIIGGIKKDLLYLSSLNPPDNIIQRRGKFNIDKKFIRPQTNYRKRNELPRLTIRELLAKKEITMLDAIGVRHAFSKDPRDIDKVRVVENRRIANKYGHPMTWDSKISTLRDSFEKEKRKWGIAYRTCTKINPYFTKDQYKSIQTFLDRASFHTGKERENYLRYFSIGSWIEVAPKIMSLARQIEAVRYVQEQTTSVSEERFRRARFLPIEDSNIDQFTLKVEMLNDTEFIELQSYRKYCDTEGRFLEIAAAHGIVPDGMKVSLENQIEIARRNNVIGLNGGTIEKLEFIKSNKYRYSAVTSFKPDKVNRFGNNSIIKAINDAYDELRDHEDPTFTVEDYIAAVQELSDKMMLTCQNGYYKPIWSLPTEILNRGVQHRSTNSIKAAKAKLDSSFLQSDLNYKIEFLAANKFAVKLKRILGFDSRYSDKTFVPKDLAEEINNDYARAKAMQDFDNETGIDSLTIRSNNFIIHYDALIRILEINPGLDSALLNICPSFTHDIEDYLVMKSWQRNEIPVKGKWQDFDLSKRNKDIYKVKSLDISQAIRRGGTKSDKIKISDFQQKVYRKICKDEGIIRLIMGLGKKSDGTRYLDKHGNPKYHWKVDFVKDPTKAGITRNIIEYAFYRIVGFEKVATGEDREYSIPPELANQFNIDCTKGLVKFEVEQLHSAFYRLEQKVNDILLGFNLATLIQDPDTQVTERPRRIPHSRRYRR